MKYTEYREYYDSPSGFILITYTAEGITGLRFSEKKDTGLSSGNLPVIVRTNQWLDTYFAGQNPGPIPPLCLSVTPFCQKVYETVQKIPYGSVAAYKDIAFMIDPVNGQHLYRAVGQALSRNPVLLLIPCHRVIRQDGSTGGYAGTERRKRYLLTLERRSSQIY